MCLPQAVKMRGHITSCTRINIIKPSSTQIWGFFQNRKTNSNFFEFDTHVQSRKASSNNHSIPFFSTWKKGHNRIVRVLLGSIFFRYFWNLFSSIYYVKRIGGLRSQWIRHKWTIGTHGNWKNENPGAILELPAKQYCQSSPFTWKLDQMGSIGSAV